MYKEVRRWTALACALALLAPAGMRAAEVGPDVSAESAEIKAHFDKVRALRWIEGPTTVDTLGNSKLVVPEGYVFLDQDQTDRFLELNENMAGGKEMMVAPRSLEWTAYLSFSDDGYVEDDEKIDSAALLKSLREGTEAANADRRERGWSQLHVTGWAVEPAYNAGTQRLEWATRLASDNSGESINFFTKILGRRGHSTVILVASPEDLQTAESDLNGLLTGYSFNPGEKYAEWVPGDKVAEYGLAALVLGGAAAVATKKGLWAVLGGVFAASWKFLAAGAVAVGAGLRKYFARKDA
jgi:uncharacterized membrane-anchored protein